MGRTKKGRGIKLRFSKEEAIKLFNDLFEFHGKRVILEPLFREYFKKIKKLTDDEIDDLIMEGRYEYKIINVGVEMIGSKSVLAIWRPEDISELSLEVEEEILKKLGRGKKGIFAVGIN